MMNIDLIEKARIFAGAAHAAAGNMRKYTNENYIVHPIEVANIVRNLPGRSNEMVAAAYLHDVVEDTQVDISLIDSEFGQIVSEYVSELTDPISTENRKTRVANKAIHLGNATREVQTIKFADIISNTSSIIKYDPKFAEVYIKEIELYLEFMTKGDRSLYERIKETIDIYNRDKGL